MSQPAPAPSPQPAQTAANAWLLAGLWTALLAVSLWWNLDQHQDNLLELARTQARMAHAKDLLYRRWNAQAGGVYAPVGEKIQPNPFLDAPERDITTPGGRRLTLMNPAYMTRLVHELGLATMGMRASITSLKPLRPANAPDPWEARALQAFEQGRAEVSSLEIIDGREHLRLMRPLPYEEGCQACHGHQGYRLGDVRGGISVAVPMEPLRQASHGHALAMIASHAGLWGLGLLGIWFAARRIQTRQRQRLEAEAMRERALRELIEAQAQVRTLSGLLPICANCKKIRDESGGWQVMEKYIHDHSQADFTHTICPDCARRLYPELMKK